MTFGVVNIKSIRSLPRLWVGGGFTPGCCIQSGLHKPHVWIKVANFSSWPFPDIGLSNVNSRGQNWPVWSSIPSLASRHIIISNESLIIASIQDCKSIINWNFGLGSVESSAEQNCCDMARNCCMADVFGPIDLSIAGSLYMPRLSLLLVPLFYVEHSKTTSLSQKGLLLYLKFGVSSY